MCASRCETAGCTVRAFAIRWWQPAGFSAIFLLLLLLLLLLLFLFLVKMAGYLLPSPFFLLPSSAFRLPSSVFLLLLLPSPSPSFSFSFSFFFFFLFISFFFPLKPWHRFNWTLPSTGLGPLGVCGRGIHVDLHSNWIARLAPCTDARGHLLFPHDGPGTVGWQAARAFSAIYHPRTPPS